MRIIINLLIKKSKAKSDGKSPVYIRCTMHGRRLEMSSGIYVLPEDWDVSGQTIKTKTDQARILNNRLEKMVSKINDVYNQLEAIGEPFDIQTIKNRLNGKKEHEHYLIQTFKFVLDSIEKKVDRGYSIETLKHYKTTLSRLKEFIKKSLSKEDILLIKVDYHFINTFDIFLKTVHHIGHNTTWGYHRHLKKVLNDAIAMNLLDRNPYINFKVKRVQANRDFLTIDEVKTIEHKELYFDRLRIVRDIFIFACYTGLSYSDISKLAKNHIQKGDDGGEWIIIDRSKNDSRCRIPILPIAKAILIRYENYPVNVSRELLLPVHSNQKMNAYLKEIATICGINKNLSMHVARHTFATSVTLSNGVPIETVSKMLGHNSIKTTQIYGRIVDKKISEDMKMVKLKLEKRIV